MAHAGSIFAAVFDFSDNSVDALCLIIQTQSVGIDAILIPVCGKRGCGSIACALPKLPPSRNMATTGLFCQAAPPLANTGDTANMAHRQQTFFKSICRSLTKNLYVSPITVK